MAVQITQPGTTQVSTAASSSYNFTGFDIGAAEDDRIVIAQITAHDAVNSVDVTSVTIGGVSATKMVGLSTDNLEEGSAVSAIWVAKVPEGTSVDISFDLSNQADRASCAALRMTGASDELVPWDTGTDEAEVEIAASVSVNINVPPQGAICAVAYTVHEGLVTWRNITELYTTEVEEDEGDVHGASEEFLPEQTELLVEAECEFNPFVGTGHVVLAVASFRVFSKGQGESDGAAITSFLSISAAAEAGTSEGSATVEGVDGSFFDPEIKGLARSEGSAVGQFVDPTFDWPRGVSEGSSRGLFFPFGFISQFYLGDVQVPNLRWGSQQVRRVYLDSHLVFRDISATSSPMKSEGKATVSAVGDFEVPPASIFREDQGHSPSGDGVRTHTFNNVSFGATATGDDRRFMVLVVGTGNGDNSVEITGARLEDNGMERVVHNEQPTGASRGASIAIFLLEYNEDIIGSIEYTTNVDTDETAWVLYKVIVAGLGEDLIDVGVSEPGSNPAEMELETNKGSAVIAGMYTNNTSNAPTFSWEGIGNVVVEKTDKAEALSCASDAVQEESSAYEVEGELTSGEPSISVGACISIGP